MISKILKLGNWDMQEIEWGITRQVIFQLHDMVEFPTIIRYFVHKLVAFYTWILRLIIQIWLEGSGKIPLALWNLDIQKSKLLDQ